MDVTDIETPPQKTQGETYKIEKFRGETRGKLMKNPSAPLIDNRVRAWGVRLKVLIEKEGPREFSDTHSLQV